MVKVRLQLKKVEDLETETLYEIVDTKDEISPKVLCDFIFNNSTSEYALFFNNGTHEKKVMIEICNIVERFVRSLKVNK